MTNRRSHLTALSICSANFQFWYYQVQPSILAWLQWKRLRNVLCAISDAPISWPKTNQFLVSLTPPRRIELFRIWVGMPCVCLGVEGAIPYLMYELFTLYTYHATWHWIFTINDPSSRVIRWRLRLAEFDTSRWDIASKHYCWNGKGNPNFCAAHHEVTHSLHQSLLPVSRPSRR